MRVIEIFQSLAFHFKCLHETRLTAVLSVTSGCGYFNLLDSNHLPRGGVEGKVHASVCSFPNEFTTDPFEYC